MTVRPKKKRVVYHRSRTLWAGRVSSDGLTVYGQLLPLGIQASFDQQRGPTLYVMPFVKVVHQVAEPSKQEKG